MAMAVKAIRFAPEESEWVEAFAEMQGKSFSALVREWVLERIEDELDTRDLQEAIAQDDGVRYSHAEIMKMYAGQ
jgi:predicted DNA-binding protein